MAIELGGITVRNLTHIAVRERARIVRHPVPGMSGDFAQTLGRSSVEVSFRGVLYGGNTVADLNRLRGAYLEHQPVDFFTEAVGEGYFAQVLISKLEVSQRAGYPEQFEFNCEVVEYVEPPEPVATDPFAALGNLLGVIPDLGNPTQALTGILDEFSDVAGGAGDSLKAISDLF